MQASIDKLRERYPEGYSSADSVKRADVTPDEFVKATWGGFDFALSDSEV